MSQVGQREILTQRHVVQFFNTKLGYDYLGHWQDRVGNSNVEQDLPLRAWWAPSCIGAAYPTAR